jgi:hypothetical protein
MSSLQGYCKLNQLNGESSMFSCVKYLFNKYVIFDSLLDTFLYKIKSKFLQILLTFI